jgi:1-acyl-sn-glycerol-3-phosphate acyltransferase
MITARKNLLVENLLAVYNKNLIRRYFNSLQVLNSANFAESTSTIPLIIYLNHSSWWDGLVAFELSRKLKLDSFIMMEEKNLKRFSFFRKIGAFSIDRDNRRSSIKSLDYIVDLLENKPNSALWIFPQGEILHNDVRPLVFYNGIHELLKN